MKKLLLFCSLACLCTSYLFAQTSTIKPDKACINCPTDEPASSAVFEIQSTDKGILLPRMTTTERTNINSPADALLVYDTDTQSFWYYNASQWQELGASLSNQNLAQVLAEGNDANNTLITNLANPVNGQDAATKTYVDISDDVDDADADPNNEIQSLSSVLTQGNDANNTLITNLANPLNNQDAATKAYVDANDEVDDADADPNNEFQDLSLSGDTLNLSDDATAVDLSAFINNWIITDGRDAAFDYNNSATGDSSTAVGYNNIADTTFSSAVGYENEASGFRSSAFGHFNEATADRSSAFGYFNDATADRSSAYGYNNEATSEESSAFGYNNDAIGEESSAFGHFNQATAERSSAFGYNNNATEFQSSAFGYSNEATRLFSSAFGYRNDATGSSSSAFGYFNEATAPQSSAFGYETKSNVYGLMAVGRYNATPVGSATTWVNTDPVFVIGNGEDINNPSTALTILKNGNVGIGDQTPDELLEVNGNVKATKFIGDGSMLTNLNSDNNWTTYGAAPIIFGFNNTVAGDSSSAVGYSNRAVGLRSSAFGYLNDATGERSSAFGYNNNATATQSSAFGYVNEATGDFSSAFGYFNKAIGASSSAFGLGNDATANQASAFGYNTISNVFGLMTVGRWNATPVGSATTWVDTDPVFIIGNGEDDSNRSTALTILKNGNIGIGTDSPQAKIQIVGGEDADEVDGGSLILGSLSGNNIGMDDNEIQARNNGAASDLYLQAGDGTGAGNVGIGTFSATARLDVNGTARIRSLPSGSGTTVVADGNGNLRLSSSSPNVNEQRINDQQAEIEDLQQENELLKAENEAIKARLAKIEALLSGKVEEVNTTTSTLTSASLSQNAPNPFDEVTTISYFIPEHIKSASLQVMDQNGRIIKRIPIQATGKGQITLQANLLSAGTYSYSLILDGRVMETKQMVLTH